MVEELFRLTQLETGILSQDAYPDMSPTYPKFTELYRYQVPVDKKLIFRPGHTFSIYAKYLNENVDAAGYFDASTPALVENMRVIEYDGGNIDLGPSISANGDYCWFGYRYKWKEMYITTLQADLDDTDADSQWDYYNGSTWSDLGSLVDGTDGFSVGSGSTVSTVSWALPGDWAVWKKPGPLVYAIRRIIAGRQSGSTLRASDIEAHQDEVVDNLDMFRIEVRDQNELVRKPLIQPSQYRTISEFTDRDKVKRLDLAAEVVAGPGMWVVISAKAISPVDVSECYFEITCDRERLAII